MNLPTTIAHWMLYIPSCALGGTIIAASLYAFIIAPYKIWAERYQHWIIFSIQFYVTLGITLLALGKLIP